MTSCSLVLVLVFASLLLHCADSFFHSANKLHLRLLQSPPKSTELHMAGFGKKVETASKELEVDASSKCACGSDKAYSECCGRFHPEGAANADTPDALVRARFSAFVYMKIGYLLQSTHPESKDYCLEEEVVGSKRTKRQIWKKQLEARASELDFANLSFDDGSEELNATGDVANLKLSLDR